MSFLTRWLTFLLLFLTVPEDAKGQPSPLFWQRKDPATAYAKKWPWDMLLDSEGWLWIGSVDGLTRTGGFETEFFQTDANDPKKLPELLISGGIFEDAEKNVWIGNNAHLARYDRSRHRFESAELKDTDGKPFGGYLRLIGLGPEKRLFVLSMIDATRTVLAKIRVDEWPEIQIEAQTALAGGIDRCRLAPPSEGFFGAAFPRGGNLVSVFGDRQPLRSLDLPHEVYDVFVESAQAVWLATSGGLFLAKSPAWQVEGPFFRTKIGKIGPKTGLSLAVAAEKGKFWMGDRDGALHLFDIEKRLFAESHFPDPSNRTEGLPSDILTNIYVDPKGSVWTGHRAPTFAWASPSKTQFSPRRLSKDGRPLVSVFELPDGGKGWATDQAIFLQPKGQKKPQKRTLPDPEAGITLVKTDGKGHIWAKDKRGKLFCFSPGSPKPQSVIGPDGEPIRALDFSIFPDGRLFVGAFKGAFLIEKKDARPPLSVPFFEKKYASLDFPSVFCDREGRVFLNQDAQKLHILEPQGANFRPVAGSPFSLNSVQMSFAENAETVWISTDFGLAAFSKKEKKIRQLGRIQGLPSEPFSAMIDDGNGGLWLGLQNALYFFDEKNRAAFRFGRTDGLPAAPFSAVQPCKSRSLDSLFFVCGPNLLTVEPKKTKRPVDAPNPQIVRILIDDEPDSTLVCQRTGATSPARIERFVLPHGRNTFSFFFTGIAATEPKGALLEYRLVGLDSTWIEAANPGFARFANVWMGEYRFEVRAIGLDGVRNPALRTVEVRILPPFYLNPWFLFFAVGAIVWAVWAFFRSKRMQREHLEQIRRQIADDLHDEVGSSLWSINRASDFVSDLVGSTERSDLEEAKTLLDRISAQSSKAQLAFRTAIWSINSENDSAADLV